MLQSALHHGGSRGTLVFLQDRTLQGTAIHADPDRNALTLGSIGYRFDSLFAANIARVDSEFIYPLLDCFQSQTIVKMNICHDWKLDLLFYFPDCLSRFHI